MFRAPLSPKLKRKVERMIKTGRRVLPATIAARRGISGQNVPSYKMRIAIMKVLRSVALPNLKIAFQQKEREVTR